MRPGSGFSQLNAPRRAASKMATEDQKRQNALAESQGPNLDPYSTEAAVMGPGSALQGFRPGSPQSLVDYLGNIGGITRGATMSRGGIGPIVPPNLRKMAGAISKKSQDVDELEQVGQAAGLERTSKQPTSGPDYLRAARSAMKHWNPTGSQGSGIRTADRLAFEKAQARLGDVGSDKLAAALGWTVEKVQHVRAGKRPPTLSLDAPIVGQPTKTLGEGLRDLDDPSSLAAVREKIGRLSPALRRDAESLIRGEKDASQLNPAVLQRLRKAMSDEPKAKIVSRGGKPISGGAAGPEDLSAEFPSHQFRDVLRRQPGQMFGAQGPAVTRKSELANTLSEYLRELAVSGGGEKLAKGAIPESQHHTLGAGRLAEDWGRIRALLGQVGQFQGRN